MPALSPPSGSIPQRTYVDGGSSHAILADEHSRPHIRQCRIKGEVHVRRRCPEFPRRTPCHHRRRGSCLRAGERFPLCRVCNRSGTRASQALSDKAAEGVAPSHNAMIAGDKKTQFPPESGCFKFEADRFTRKQ